MSISVNHIQFNPFKHHLDYVCNCLLITRRAIQSPEIFEVVKSINANFIDVYTGELSVLEIQLKIADELSRRNVTNESEYQTWLGEKGFQLLKLCDASSWVLRKSEHKKAFVHIHPSRTPPLAIRFHGNAWKTVVGLLILFPEYLNKIPTLLQINTFRKEFLHLSPVKGTENLKRIMSVYEIILLYLSKDLITKA
jgi:hypothetical protein